MGVGPFLNVGMSLTWLSEPMQINFFVVEADGAQEGPQQWRLEAKQLRRSRANHLTVRNKSELS